MELAVAIAIIGIMSALAWTWMSGTVARYRLMKAGRTLQSDIQNLRSMAISQNRETRILFQAADQNLDPDDVQVGEWLLQVGNRPLGSNTWDTLPLDAGSPDSREGERSLSEGGRQESPDVSLAPWPALHGPGLANEDAIVFSPRGFVANPATDFSSGYITLRFVDKFALSQGVSSEVHLVLSRGGLARMEVSEQNTLPENDVGTAMGSSQ